MMPVRKLPLAILLAIVLVVTYFGMRYFGGNAAPQPVAPSMIPVATAKTSQMDMPIFIRSIGTVVSPHQVQIRAQVDGILNKVLVKDGQKVNRGDLLAQIDDRSIRAVIQQQRAELANRRAQLSIATLDLNRYQTLAKHDAIAKQTLDQQQAQVNQLTQAVAAQLANIKQQEVLLSHTQIHAPISGVIGIINVHAGNYIKSGDSAMLSIMQIDPILVEVSITQNALNQLLPVVQAGHLNDLPMQVFDKNTNLPLGTGNLLLLDNQISPQTGTIRVRAQLDNPSTKLWPGQTLNTLIELRALPNALVVPRPAIRQGDGYTYVWRVVEDKAYPVNVVILQTSENLAAVTGISAGDEVIIDGASRLNEGMSIQRIVDANPIQGQDQQPPPKSGEQGNAALPPQGVETPEESDATHPPSLQSTTQVEVKKEE